MTKARRLSASTRPSTWAISSKRDGIDTWVAGGGTIFELGQFPAVAARQMLAGSSDLIFDEVEIVEEPFGGGGDAAAALDGVGDQHIGVSEDMLIVAQARQKEISPSAAASAIGDLVPAGEALGVTV